MALAIFDLDNTLLADDSDYLWGVYLSELGIVDRAYYESENERFYREYKEGNLDIMEFLRFSLTPLKQNRLEDLHQWRQSFIEQKIAPLILPKATDLIERHRSAGDTLMIITATNAFVTTPIAELLGIDHLIATDPEFVNGQYTGEVSGTPSFREGKVTRLNQWMEKHQATLSGSYFYSDSHNDIPLLQMVDNPFAVDPDETLRAHAEQQGWPVISLRG